MLGFCICELQLLLLEVNRTLLFLGQEHGIERSVRPHLLCEPGSVSERGLGRQPQVPVFILRDFCEYSGLEQHSFELLDLDPVEFS
jgi:hypothetical protein